VSTLIVIDDGGDVRGKKHAVLLRDVSSKDEIAAEGASERASEREKKRKEEREREGSPRCCSLSLSLLYSFETNRHKLL